MVEIEVELATGLRIQSQVSDEDVIGTQLGLTGAILMQGDRTERERALTVAATALAFRMERRDGFLTLTDREGRFWMIRADAIVAGAVRDPDDPAATRRPGFQPPDLETA